MLTLVAEDIEWIIPGSDWPLGGTHRGRAWVGAAYQMASEEVPMTISSLPLPSWTARSRTSRSTLTCRRWRGLRGTRPRLRSAGLSGILRGLWRMSRGPMPCTSYAHRILYCEEDPMYDQSKLAELIRFSRVDAGATVIDVYPGDGDWTRLFSDVVGPEGRVYSFVPAEVAHFKNDPVGLMRTLAKEPGRENVEVVSADLVAMPQATRPADVLWLHLFYHDLHTALMQAKGATAAEFNRAVYERLKSGGYYVIVDHATAAGVGMSNAQSLHRIDPVSVREEVEAAGFVLDAESTVLANKDDPHSSKVFDPSIKGETDRFAYRFVKP
jgi:predicted methyltransferase